MERVFILKTSNRCVPKNENLSNDIEKLREFIADLKKDWKRLWRTRIDDKVRAEGVASQEFPRLFVDRGTVIIATKDYKPPSFNEIVNRYVSPEIKERIMPNPRVGGVNKFIKEFIKKKTRQKRLLLEIRKTKRRQQRKTKAGWLHYKL